jgi:hypothetical protein
MLSKNDDIALIRSDLENDALLKGKHKDTKRFRDVYSLGA